MSFVVEHYLFGTPKPGAIQFIYILKQQVCSEIVESTSFQMTILYTLQDQRKTHIHGPTF